METYLSRSRSKEKEDNECVRKYINLGDQRFYIKQPH